MKKIICVVLLLCVFVSSYSSVTIFASDANVINNNATDEKIICQAKIDEDFESDSVIVVLNNAKS